MDAGSLNVMQRVIALGGRSLLQYVSQSSPFETEKSHAALAHILDMAHEESDRVGTLLRYLQKKHVRLDTLGSYPAYFTQMNFLRVDYLVPKLIKDAAQQIAAIEKGLPAVTDEEVHAMLLAYLDMKRRHVQTLNASLVTPV